MIYSEIGAAGVTLEMVHCVRLGVFPVGKEVKNRVMSSRQYYIFRINFGHDGNYTLPMPAYIKRGKKRTYTIDKADNAK